MLFVLDRYGVKVRFPHALVMSVLFKDARFVTIYNVQLWVGYGTLLCYFIRYSTDTIAVYMIFSLLGHMQGILEATFIHSRNLALLSLGYKVLTACLRYLESTKREHHSFLAAFVCGYFIFGQFNKITEQVHLETLGFIFRICNYIALIRFLLLFFCKLNKSLLCYHMQMFR